MQFLCILIYSTNIAFIYNNVEAVAVEKLILAHVIFRHGDRTVDANTIYPNDPYRNETYWPYGLGQLTNKGKDRMYLLGKFLRSRYDNFLGPYYTPDIVDPTSTNVNRTKMSLELVLAGLFPPKDIQIWNKDFPWQPIPYNCLPEGDLISGAMFCPNLLTYVSDYLKESLTQSKYKKYLKVFEYLSKHSGLEVKSLFQVLQIWSSLISEYEWGFKLPEWTNEVFPDKLKKLAGLGFAELTQTANLKKLIAGGLFEKIVKDSKAKIQGNLNPQSRKLYLYSAHDVNVAGVLNTLGIFDSSDPPFYGSAVLIEIYEVNGNYRVKVFFKRNTDSPLEQKILPKCGKICSLTEFESIVSKYYPDENTCGNN